MANEKRKTVRPRFNIYWMWGIIIAIILGWSYFGGSGQQSKIGWDMLSDTLMRNGDLQRVQVVNREVAQVWLKPQAVARYKAQERFRYIPEQGPQFFLNIGSLEKFETDYQAAADSVDASEIPFAGVLAVHRRKDLVGAALDREVYRAADVGVGCNHVDGAVAHVLGV